MKRVRSFTGILAAVLLSFVVHAAAARAAELDLNAPLPVDPNVRMVTLPNGLQCWLRAHATPPERVGIWLHVGSGSINERDDQRGLAHFLEHLAFEGSEHFPPGELIRYFESIGLTFGHHQNAFTSFDQTTYILTLPNTDAETMQKGLLCMADFAFRLSLPQERIDKERGVVLEETQARKGPGQRTFEKLLPAVLPGSRVAERLPIGREDVVRSVGREQFVRYYKTWYRPDNSVLMVVGDVNLDKAEAMVRAAFADWQPVADPPENAPLGIVPYAKTRAAVIADPEVTTASTSIIGVRPIEPEQTVGDFRRSLVDGIGRWVVNRRLDQMVNEGKAPFQSASLNKSTLWNVCTYLEAEATGAPERWRDMLHALAVEVKRAREHGIMPRELEDARKALLASVDQAVRTEGTRDARVLLDEMNDLISEHRKPLSAAQRRELLTALLDTVTADEVAASIRRDFALDTCLVLVTVPEAEGRALPSQEDLLAVAAEADAEDVAPPVARTRALGLLDRAPRPGAVARQELDPDLQILTATLTNGVRVHLRSMDFKKDQVLVRIVLAGGVPWETPASRGLTEVAALAFQQPATSRLASTDVRNLLTGKNVKVTGSAQRESVALEISGTPDDVEEGFRLAHALLTEPLVEPAALKTWRQSTRQALESRRTDVREQMGDAADRLLTGGDLRFRPLTPALLNGLTPADGQRWLDRIVRTAPLEIAVVGDIPRERALELVLKYLGSLSPRTEVGPLPEDVRKLFPRAGPLSAAVEVDTITPTAATLVGWRGADWSDVKERRCLQIAAQIITSRLREELREKRGVAYSPYCLARPAQAYPGTGMFACLLAGDPANASAAAELMRAAMERFANEGPTDEEMATARKQFANQIETQQKEPRYWLGVLSEADYNGTRVRDVKEAMEKYTSYTARDLQRAVRRYMKDAGRIEVTARPKGQAVLREGRRAGTSQRSRRGPQ